jgi:hypothetical protein
MGPAERNRAADGTSILQRTRNPGGGQARSLSAPNRGCCFHVRRRQTGPGTGPGPFAGPIFVHEATNSFCADRRTVRPLCRRVRFPNELRRRRHPVFLPLRRRDDFHALRPKRRRRIRCRLEPGRGGDRGLHQPAVGRRDGRVPQAAAARLQGLAPGADRRDRLPAGQPDRAAANRPGGLRRFGAGLAGGGGADGLLPAAEQLGVAGHGGGAGHAAGVAGRLPGPRLPETRPLRPLAVPAAGRCRGPSSAAS